MWIKHILLYTSTNSHAASSRFHQHTPCFSQSTCLMSSTPPCTWGTQMIVRRGHNYWCSFSKTPSLGSWVQVSGSGSITIHSITAMLMVTMQKLLPLKIQMFLPFIPHYHSSIHFCLAFWTGTCVLHPRKLPGVITINCSCGNENHSSMLPWFKPLRARAWLQTTVLTHK